MSEPSYDSWNRPPDVYDVNNRRGRLNGEKYPGLWWRKTAKGPIVWELKMSQNGKDRSRPLVATTEREAIKEWKILTGASAKGETVIAAGDVTLATAAEAFFASFEEAVANGTRKRSTYWTYHDSYRLHIEPVLGAKRIARLDVDDIAAYLADLRKDGLAGFTRNGILTVLRNIFNTALRKKWVVVNPILALTPAELPQQRKSDDYVSRLLRPEEFRKAVEKANPIYRNALTVLGYTGLRISELCGLVWGDVHSDRLEITKQLVWDRESSSYSRGEPKAKRSIRPVTLMPEALAALDEQFKLERGKGLGNPSDFVFTNEDGGVLDVSNFRKRGVNKACADAGLGHVRPHDLRHTTASIYAQAATISDTVAARNMGMTVEVYHDTYAAAFDDARERENVVEALTELEFGHIRTVAE